MVEGGGRRHGCPHVESAWPEARSDTWPDTWPAAADAAAADAAAASAAAVPDAGRALSQRDVQVEAALHRGHAQRARASGQGSEWPPTSHHPAATPGCTAHLHCPFTPCPVTLPSHRPFTLSFAPPIRTWRDGAYLQR